MSKPPKEFSRITKKKKPEHQLYQPGFNPANGCWLEGSWVTLPEAEWLARKDAHVHAYQGVYQEARHYRDPAVPIDQMTSWQRQAYEHYSGQVTVEALDKNGLYGGISIDMAGAVPNAKSLVWLRECGYRILPRIRNGYTGVITSQVEGYAFPADVVAPDIEPVPDPWKHIIEQNRARAKSFYAAGLNISEGGSVTDGVMGSLSSFGATMVISGLIESEESIVRMEWDKVRGQKDPYANPEEERADYVEARKAAKASLGENFELLYTSQKASHNSCARSNLDNSSGSLFSFVLPEFRDDGTHEPWGEHDVPWEQTGD